MRCGDRDARDGPLISHAWNAAVYGLYEITPQLVQITLPPPANIPLPFGHPYAVYLIRGTTFAMVDTGFKGSRPALLAAFAELGVSPLQISKVLLTHGEPSATGNVSLFERAMVIGHPGGNAPELEKAIEEVRYEADLLLSLSDKPESWTQDTVDRFEAAYRAERPDAFPLLEVDDGAVVQVAGRRTRVLHTPGVASTAISYDVDGTWLFVGPTMVIVPEPEIQDSQAFADSVGRLTKIEPQLVLPAYGGVIHTFHWHYRSISLYVNNLLSNFQFVLKRPLSAAELILKDLGRQPNDLIRLAATIRRSRVLLTDLTEAGILTTSGDGAARRYVLGEGGSDDSPIGKTFASG